MHYIQKKILDTLIYNENRRYSELRPTGIESNNFAYHLKQLIRGKLVIKNGTSYTLSSAGKAHVDRVSHETLDIRKQPKIITLLSITNAKGELLLARRLHQPLIGLVGYPTGKLHVGEKVADAAQREVVEKLGINEQKLTHLGVLNIAISQDGGIISQVLAMVYSGSVKHAASPSINRRAEHFWASSSELEKLPMIPGFIETKKHIASGKEFFDEFDFSL